MVDSIKKILDEIRSYLQADGGDIEFVDYTPEKIVRVRLLGHCATCPHARMTIEGLIQEQLQTRLGAEIQSVEAV